MNGSVSASDADVVSKSEFARRRNVSPGRVTQWIGEGKISGAALVGEGRSAQIRVSVAVEQLRKKLGTDQRFGLNGLGTQLDLEAPPSTPSSEAAPLVPRAPTIEDRIAAEKLREIQFRNRRRDEDEALRAGTLTSADDAKRNTAKIIAQVVNQVEAAHQDYATAIAATFKIPQRDVVHLLRQEFRKVRGRLAELMRRDAADLPAVIDLELEGHAEMTEDETATVD